MQYYLWGLGAVGGSTAHRSCTAAQRHSVCQHRAVHAALRCAGLVHAVLCQCTLRRAASAAGRAWPSAPPPHRPPHRVSLHARYSTVALVLTAHRLRVSPNVPTRYPHTHIRCKYIETHHDFYEVFPAP